MVPISAIEHHAYCPRQAALIHVDGIWFENAATERGARGHNRADTAFERMERGVRVVRAVPLWSERLGLSGRADAVAFDEAGSASPIEYKIGGRHGRAAELQLCAEALCLEEMLGRPVEMGYVWYAATRRRARVTLGLELRAETLRIVADLRRCMSIGQLPTAVDDERCASCQLVDICLPEVTAHPARVQAMLDGLLACDF